MPLMSLATCAWDRSDYMMPIIHLRGDLHARQGCYLALDVYNLFWQQTHEIEAHVGVLPGLAWCKPRSNRTSCTCHFIDAVKVFLSEPSLTIISWRWKSSSFTGCQTCEVDLWSLSLNSVIFIWSPMWIDSIWPIILQCECSHYGSRKKKGYG